MFVVFTSAAYNHHKLSVSSAFSVRVSPFKSYQPISLLAFVMVLYRILPSNISPHTGRGWLYARVIPSIYLHCLSKEPDWSISCQQWMFRSPSLPRGLVQWYNLSHAVSHSYSVPAAQLCAVEPENAI